jgi:hypothetical protein
MDRLASYFSIINFLCSRTNYFSACAIVGTLSRYLEWDRLCPLKSFSLEVVVHARF